MTRGLKGLLSVMVFLGVWEFVSRSKLVDPLLLPPPSSLLFRARVLLERGDLLGHVGASLFRVLLGFIMAIVVSFPLGLLLGLYPKVADYFDPFLQLFRPLAPPAWIPLAILWFGIGDRAAIFIIFIGTVFSMLLGIMGATRRVNKELVKVGLTLGADQRKAVFYIVIPSIMPFVFTQLRIGLALAWMCVVASEMVAVERGIGFMMMEARNLFRTEDVLLGMAIVGALGYGLDLLIRQIEHKALKWTKGLMVHELFGGNRSL